MAPSRGAGWLHHAVADIQAEPERAADGQIYQGRLTLHDAQWVRNPQEYFLRTNLTLRQLLDAAETNMLWTDQSVQRGIQPTAKRGTPIELPLSAGYPDERYVFDADKADEIAQRLLGGASLHLHPLTWNLRPGTFRAFWDEGPRRVYLYEGRIYLPDSHHRHQGIIKAARLFFESPKEYPKFALNELSVDLYFMTKTAESEFFYEKNLLPKPTSKSKAFDLTSQDAPAVIAKLWIDKSTNLTQNVNRVTDRLAASNPQVVTLSTLRQVAKDVLADEFLTEGEADDLASRLARFYDLLVEARPELGLLDVSERKQVRRDLMVDSAVVIHGFIPAMRGYVDDSKTLGDQEADKKWRATLIPLREEFKYGDFAGDFFSKKNPLWGEKGILQPTKAGGLAVSNTRQTRDLCRQIISETLRLA